MTSPLTPEWQFWIDVIAKFIAPTFAVIVAVLINIWRTRNNSVEPPQDKPTQQ